jgi:hypothetical protein
LSTLPEDWFPTDPGMQMPRTRAEIGRENKATHVLSYDEDGLINHCKRCGRSGSLLSAGPCKGRVPAST